MDGVKRLVDIKVVEEGKCEVVINFEELEKPNGEVVVLSMGFDTKGDISTFDPNRYIPARYLKKDGKINFIKK